MKHPTELPREPSGNAKEVSWFRILLKCVLQRSIKVGPGLRASYRVDGTLIELEGRAASGGAGGTIQQYKVTVISDDSITCRTWDGTTDGTSDVIVAKPYRLRKTPWNGITVVYDFNGTSYSIVYSYLATPGFRTAQVTVGGTQTTESQAIIPIYKVGDIIYATEPEGGTDVFVGSAVTWLDLNVDARAWACY